MHIFGHSVCPEKYYPVLKKQIINLINQDVTEFLVGDRGDFDKMALKVLKELTECYNIKYKVVLAYLPSGGGLFADDYNSIFPEELATVHKRFAIEYRNMYMINNSDYVIVYTPVSFGGAAKFAKKAEKKCKLVIDISKLPSM